VRRSGSDRGVPQPIEGVSTDPEGIIRFSGQLGTLDSACELESCFSAWHAANVSLRRSCVIVDVSSLTWASESAVRSFVRWAMWIEGEPASIRYRLVFRIDATVAWQAAAFTALASLAPETVRVIGVSSTRCLSRSRRR
jgi:hypothetical protein